MILPYLILSHLLGDFVLQPSWMVKWKMRNIWGVIVHVLVHFILMVLILLPFMINGEIEIIYPIIIVAIIHFIIDRSKISYDLKHDSKVKPFVIDQLLHIFTIIFATVLFSDISPNFPHNNFYKIYLNPNVLYFIAILIFITEVIEIYKFQLEREKNSKAKLKLNSKNISIRVAVFTILYLIFMLLSFASNYLTG